MVGPGLRTGMPLRYENPREIGADRLVNAIAGYERVDGPPAWSSTSARRSRSTSSPPRASTSAGSSRPGVEISLAALTERGAAALPRIDLIEPRVLVGKTTIDAIRSGVVYGYAAMVDGMVRGCASSSARRPRSSPRAAWRASIVPFCEEIDDVDDLLTLTGLRLIWERNLDEPNRAEVGRNREAEWVVGNAARRPTTAAQAAQSPAGAGDAAARALPTSRRASVSRPLAPRRPDRPQPRVVLAPLAGIGNWFVRLQAKRYGAGIAGREMVSSFAIHYGNERTLTELLRARAGEEGAGAGRHPALRPGPRGDALGAARSPRRRAADLIDLNMGCPVPKVDEDGRGRRAARRTPTPRSPSRAPRARAPGCRSP